MEKSTGCVKWFNNKAGYGFVTVKGGDQDGKDVFVHYSTIKVANDQFRYLVQGEYIEFELCKDETGKHEFVVGNVSGIKGGQLMCEANVARVQNAANVVYRYKKEDDGFKEVQKRKRGPK